VVEEFCSRHREHHTAIETEDAMKAQGSSAVFGLVPDPTILAYDRMGDSACWSTTKQEVISAPLSRFFDDINEAIAGKDEHSRTCREPVNHLRVPN
jgi:hypothetical protein